MSSDKSNDLPFINIPGFVANRDDLTRTEKYIYGVINGLAHKTGYCFASNYHLAQKVGCSESTITKTVSKIKDIGLWKVKTVTYTKKDEVNPKKLGTKRYITPFQLEEIPRGVVTSSEGGSNQLRGGVVTSSEHSSKDSIKVSYSEVEENTQKPSPEYKQWLEQKKENETKKKLKDKHGGSIPPWVDVKEAVDKITHKPATREQTEKFLDVFNDGFNRQFRVTKNKRTLLGKRLEKFSLEEILDAVRGMSKSAWHRGDNDSNWKATPSFVLKDDDTVDKWRNQSQEDKPKILPNGNIMKKMLINGKMKWTEVAVNRLEDLTGKDKEIALEQIKKYKEFKEKNEK